MTAIVELLEKLLAERQQCVERVLEIDQELEEGRSLLRRSKSKTVITGAEHVSHDVVHGSEPGSPDAPAESPGNPVNPDPTMSASEAARRAILRLIEAKPGLQARVIFGELGQPVSWVRFRGYLNKLRDSRLIRCDGVNRYARWYPGSKPTSTPTPAAASSSPDQEDRTIESSPDQPAPALADLASPAPEKCAGVGSGPFHVPCKKAPRPGSRRCHTCGEGHRHFLGSTT